MEKAQAIAYRTFTRYLTPTSNYQDCRTQSVTAAIDLFGVNSVEVITVTNAWYAVGVGAASPAVLAGKPIICESNVYSVYNLPANATVTWSLTANSNNFYSLVPNSPQTNQVTFNNGNHFYQFPTSVVATVTIPGSSPVTYSQSVINDTYYNFSVPYQQDACMYYNVSHPAQSGNASTNSATFVHMGCMVRVTLNLPADRTITVTGGTRDYWYYSNGILYFALPIGSGGIPFNFNIVPTVNDGRCSRTLLFFAYNNNSNAYAYMIAPNPVESELNILVKDNEYQTTDNSTTKVLTTDQNRTIKKKEHQFTIKVYDLIYNKLVYTGKSTRGSMKERFNIATLRPGNYAAVIDDGYKTQSIKFIKN